MLQPSIKAEIEQQDQELDGKDKLIEKTIDIKTKASL